MSYDENDDTDDNMHHFTIIVKCQQGLVIFCHCRYCKVGVLFTGALGTQLLGTTGLLSQRHCDSGKLCSSEQLSLTYTLHFLVFSLIF